MARYQADKLQRWALVMSTFSYTIEGIPGDLNDWGDLLSRWGSTPSVARISNLVAIVAPMQRSDFEWPSPASILAIQRSFVDGEESPPTGVEWNDTKSYYMNNQGRIWTPDTCVDLQVRLCVIAHRGIGGDRRVDATCKAIADVFVWSTMEADVKSFVQA
ncbi:unnamed protein product [Aphanomyces euteiches]